MISFLIADDHSISRVGIKTYIKEFFSPYYIMEAKNGDELFEKLKERDFDILITDINMPNTDIYRIIDTVLHLKPNLKILVCSMNKERVFAASFLKMGVKGYIEKNANEKEMVRAIQTVLDGDMYISPSFANSLIIGNVKLQDNPFDKLAGRESQICDMLCEGKSVTEIGKILNLDISTISKTKANIFSKLGVSSLVELIKLQQM